MLDPSYRCCGKEAFADGEKKLTCIGFTSFTGRGPCVKAVGKKCDFCGECGRKNAE